MSRRSTPERLHAARREATLRRLIGEGELPQRAEAWITAWEAEAARQGMESDGAYWDAGWEWIVVLRKRPDGRR
jgi:hypothetical protein